MTDAQITALLHSMSLEEKVCQLSQLPPTFYHSAEAIPGTEIKEQVSETLMNQMGSILYISDAAVMKTIQDRALDQQPHKIPMLFMMDVIHGFKTVFPIPLAQAGTFDMELISKCASTAAAEASAAGIHTVFSPMLDLVRDARWGRVMESAGEDPMLGSEVGTAMISGYQGGNGNSRAEGQASACFKHFAAYGAAEGGRDYNNAEVSEHTLRSVYLPAYQAAVQAGCDMAMTSFNTWNGIPSSGNPWLLTHLLREEWGFEGVVISDWNAIGELVEHGVCKDLKEAAYLAFRAGVDIDMCSFAYAKHLKSLVEEGRIPEEDLDWSVLRVLRLKNKHGLFEDPYKGISSKQSDSVLLAPEHRSIARRAVRESLVLLKNSGDTPLLPLQKGQNVALIGPFVHSSSLLSSWAPSGDERNVVTIAHAAEEVSRDYRFSYDRGCVLNTRDDYHAQSMEESIQAIREGAVPDLALNGSEDDTLWAETLEKAAQADIAVVCIGEHPRMSGEGASRGDITIPQPQMELLKKVWEVNENIVTVVFAGRPLDLREVCRYSKSILYAWLPGTEGGHGIMDVFTGAYNPSGKLAMSIPYHVGQIPVYYNAYRTGRPKPNAPIQSFYTSAYNDIPNAPLYPFGFGLSYTKFTYSPIKLDASTMTPGEQIKASVEVTNAGQYTGTETVQLYLRDMVGSAARPVRMLKGFQRVTLEPGESKPVTFAIDETMLRFYRADMTFASEPGEFEVYIGMDSDTRNGAGFTLAKEARR